MSHSCKKDCSAVMLDITTELFALLPAKTVKALASNYCNEVTWQYSYSYGGNDPVPHPKQLSILKYQ
jgi:hypothetical protein